MMSQISIRQPHSLNKGIIQKFKFYAFSTRNWMIGPRAAARPAAARLDITQKFKFHSFLTLNRMIGPRAAVRPANRKLRSALLSTKKLF